MGRCRQYIYKGVSWPLEASFAGSRRLDFNIFFHYNGGMFDLRQVTIYQVLFTAIPMVFGVVHLVLFYFLRRARENLYFAIFLFFYGVAIFFDYQHIIVTQEVESLVYLRLHRLTAPLFIIFALKFLDVLFGTRPAWVFRVMVLLLCISSLLGVIDPPGFALPISIISGFSILVVVWIIAGAVRSGKEEAGLAAFGFFILFFFSLFDYFMDAGILDVFHEMYNPYALGTVGFVLSMSVFLARRYARTYELMLNRERAAGELEEARKMQLGMLPSCLSGLPGLEICFHMSTATEVGGDYYDYLTPDPETVVLAVGDATGHGLKAGMMVASVKTLFRSLGDNRDIPAFFSGCGRTLKQMNMGRMYMALTILRLNIRERRFTVSAAGMPPILIFRADSGEVEEIVIKAPPLGAIAGFTYVSRSFTIGEGDVVLVMSDGFAELFSEAGEMLGYGRVRGIFRKMPQAGATEAVHYLMSEAAQWRGNRGQEDDITLMVIRAIPAG